MVIRSIRDLRVYQRRFVALIIDTRSLILSLPMGAGKTVIVLTAISKLLASGRVKKVLIVAPKNAAVS